MEANKPYVLHRMLGFDDEIFFLFFARDDDGKCWILLSFLCWCWSSKKLSTYKYHHNKHSYIFSSRACAIQLVILFNFLYQMLHLCDDYFTLTNLDPIFIVRYIHWWIIDMYFSYCTCHNKHHIFIYVYLLSMHAYIECIL